MAFFLPRFCNLYFNLVLRPILQMKKLSQGGRFEMTCPELSSDSQRSFHQTGCSFAEQRGCVVLWLLVRNSWLGGSQHLIKLPSGVRKADPLWGCLLSSAPAPFISFLYSNGIVSNVYQHSSCWLRTGCCKQEGFKLCSLEP